MWFMLVILFVVGGIGALFQGLAFMLVGLILGLIWGIFQIAWFFVQLRMDYRKAARGDKSVLTPGDWSRQP